jgi:hypothetical protein
VGWLTRTTAPVYHGHGPARLPLAGPGPAAGRGSEAGLGQGQNEKGQYLPPPLERASVQEVLAGGAGGYGAKPGDPPAS